MSRDGVRWYHPLHSRFLRHMAGSFEAAALLIARGVHHHVDDLPRETAIIKDALDERKSL